MAAPLRTAVWTGPASPTPAILIHGTFSWAALAFENQRPLARHRRILLPDRRGFGGSPDLDGEVTSDYAVDAVDVVGLMADGVHLVGHSYGGTVAMIAAAARPDLVRSLTLMMGQVMQTVGATVTDRIGARLVRVAGAAHEPHREQPAAVNDLLSRLWSTD